MSTLRVLLVPADERPATWIHVEHDWQALAETIGAQWIEHVRTPHAGLAMIVDEEGLLTGRPTNRVSGVLYPGRIVGDVLLCGEVYNTLDGLDIGSLTSCPDKLLDWLGVEAETIPCHE